MFQWKKNVEECLVYAILEGDASVWLSTTNCFRSRQFHWGHVQQSQAKRLLRTIDFANVINGYSMEVRLSFAENEEVGLWNSDSVRSLLPQSSKKQQHDCLLDNSVQLFFRKQSCDQSG